MLACEMATAARARCFNRSPCKRQSNREHVEDHSQLSNHTQEGSNRSRKDERGCLRPQQRRPEQDSRNDLADDRRLPHIGEALRQDQANNNDSSQRNEDSKKNIGGIPQRRLALPQFGIGRGLECFALPADQKKKTMAATIIRPYPPTSKGTTAETC